MKNDKAAYDFWIKNIVPYIGRDNELSQKLYKKELEYFRDIRKSEFSKKKIELAKKAIKKISWIKWIKVVAITGSVATGWCTENDDIDFLLICEKNRMWICRILTLLWLKILGFKIRNFSGNKNINNSLCFNIWIDESDLVIPKSRQNLLSAFDFVWMKQIIEQGNVWEEFLTMNSWVNRYITVKKIVKKNQYISKNNFLGLTIINKICFTIQMAYMKKKISGEIVDINKAYFHPQGRRYFDKIRSANEIT